MGLLLKTGPVIEPVTLAEAKKHLRVEHPDEDSLVDNLIQAAREHLEERTARQFITATWVKTLAFFPTEIRLPRPNLQSVVSVKYRDLEGTEQPLADTNYQVVTDEWVGRIVPAYGKSWPSTRAMPEAVTVEYKAGYGDTPNDVPLSIRQAILLLVGHFYEHREAVTEMRAEELPMAVEALIGPYRVLEG